jgi:hypothetical protein
MRAVKRERYGEKELDRLNKMLAAAGELPTDKDDTEVKMEPDAASICIPVIPVKARKPRKPKGEGRKSRKDEVKDVDDGDYEDVVEMEDLGSAGEGDDETADDATKKDRVFSKRSMKDQFGNYPDWMNKRKMRTQQNKNKRIAKRRALSLSGKRRK